MAFQGGIPLLMRGPIAHQGSGSPVNHLVMPKVWIRQEIVVTIEVELVFTMV